MMLYELVVVVVVVLRVEERGLGLGEDERGGGSKSLQGDFSLYKYSFR